MKALELKGLKKVYANGKTALEGIDLTVNDGDFFALLGPNGAGKSTTIGIITSLVRKTAGTVKVYGIDTDLDFQGAKTHIGVVPQEFNFSLFETVWDIVVNQAGYYGISRARGGPRRKLFAAARALGQTYGCLAHPLGGHETSPDDRPRTGA